MKGEHMALRDFWISVRTASRLHAPQPIVDAPQLDAGEIERILRGANLWLTPDVVAGFDEKDFSFLPEAEQTRLAKLVTEFRQEASNVSPTTPMPNDALERALPLFRDIALALGFDRYEDAEAYRLGKQIEQKLQPHWPKEIAELRFNTGLDHTGDPALWIWVFLTEEVSKDDEDFLRAAQRLRAILDPIARRVAPDRWPYPSFRPITEPAETVEAS
jgi:hypothetical protein